MNASISGTAASAPPLAAKCLPAAEDFLADFQKAITMGPQFHSESGAQIGQVIDKRKVPVDLDFYQSDSHMRPDYYLQKWGASIGSMGYPADLWCPVQPAQTGPS